MNSSTLRFNLDLHTVQSQISIPVLIGDTGRTWRVTLSDGGEPYKIKSGCLAKLSIVRPTGTKFEEFCTIENETTIVYNFEQNENTAAVEGLHDCDITLYSPNGVALGSPRFSMVVSDRVIPRDDIVVTDEDRNILDSMISAEAARVSAEEGRVTAEAERAAAEAERVAAEELREVATGEAIANAKSAYTIAVENGYEGTEEEFGEGLALVASVVIYDGEAVDIE